MFKVVLLMFNYHICLTFPFMGGTVKEKEIVHPLMLLIICYFIYIPYMYQISFGDWWNQICANLNIRPNKKISVFRVT